MELVNWIGKNINEIKETLLYNKYFDSMLIEKGIDVSWVLNPELGIDLKFNEDFVVKSIHFYSGNQKGVKQFVDELPYGLSFSFSKNITRNLLGVPNENGGGGYHIFYGKIPFWDKYDFKDFYLHLQFTDEGEILDLVTLDMK